MVVCLVAAPVVLIAIVVWEKLAPRMAVCQVAETEIPVVLMLAAGYVQAINFVMRPAAFVNHWAALAAEVVLRVKFVILALILVSR